MGILVKKSNIAKVIFFLILFIALILSIIFFHPVKQYTLLGVQKIAKFGWPGWFIVEIIFVVTSILGISGSFAALSFACGFVYDHVGFPIAYIGVILGCEASFYVGKFILHEYIRKKIAASGNGRLEALDKLIHGKGFLSLLLSRLGLFPPNITNYVFSISNISGLSYFGATAIGVVPGTFVMSFLGMGSKRCSIASPPLWMVIAFFLVLGLTIIFTAILGYWARHVIWVNSSKMANLLSETPTVDLDSSQRSLLAVNEENQSDED